VYYLRSLSAAVTHSIFSLIKNFSLAAIVLPLCEENPAIPRKVAKHLPIFIAPLHILFTVSSASYSSSLFYHLNYYMKIPLISPFVK